MIESFGRIERQGVSVGVVRRIDILALHSDANKNCETHGRATAELSRAFVRLERRAGHTFTPGARLAFQQLVAESGGRLRGSIELPAEAPPYWQCGVHPLEDFRSTPRLPSTADVVVIGAGLTGASAAFHLAPAVKRGLRVIVLEHGDPATQASGRNGGNFELIPENFLGEYQGLPRERQKWLARRYPFLSNQRLTDAAERQARLILQFGSRNAARFLNIVKRQQIDCDLSETGWLRIADTPEEERGIRNEVAFAATLGIHFDLWTPGRIRTETGIPARHSGRLARANGNYHPFKFVCGVLERITKEGVKLYARTPVVSFRHTRSGFVRIETTRGIITTRRVIFATNAFTSTLLPEMRAIRYYQSQILNLEHVRDTLKGMTITEKKGDLYYNFPMARKYVDAHGAERGMLLVGGGLDRPGKDPFERRRSSEVLNLVRRQTDERFPETRGQPPSRVWTGPMAFTPDRVPVIGFLRRKGATPDSLIIAAGFNGYGGTYCIESGRLAAQMAVEGNTPTEIPEDMFSPHRFLTPQPLPGITDLE